MPSPGRPTLYEPEHASRARTLCAPALIGVSLAETAETPEITTGFAKVA